MKIFGWILYIAVVLYAISGITYIWNASRAGGSVSQMGLFQWALSVIIAVIFGLTDINKLHIIWISLVGFIVSFTPLGLAMGQIVGVITAVFFRRRQ